MTIEAEKRKALINMDLAGTTGPHPSPGGNLDNARRRHYLGLFPFGVEPPEPITPDPYNFEQDYFNAPSNEDMSLSIASELPDGEAWKAKWIFTKYMYALVYACGGGLNILMKLIQTMATELNINTTYELLSLHEESCSLPDSRIELSNPTIEQRRNNVKKRLSKQPIVTIGEMQDLIDTVLPESGIWLSTGQDLETFRYTFRYGFGGRGYRRRFTIVVNTPEFALDQISWTNLLNWLQDFGNAGVHWIQNIIPSDQSYVVITYPTNYQTIYAQQDFIGNWLPITVKWKAIDKLNTVVNNSDEQIIVPSTTTITRSFIDSDTVYIEASTTPTVIEI